MKKLITALICTMMIFGVTGCGAADDKKEDSTPKEETPKVTEEKDLITEMKKNITDAGYSITKETKMAADIIGGIEGMKYTTDSSKIEVYKFDKNSEAYKNAELNGTVTMEGFGDFEVKVNNGYVLLTKDVPTEIVDAFSNLK